MGRATRILVLTEGLLVRRLQDDPFLKGFGVLVFDEFHERNIDTDLALALARRVQREARPDLRVVVMSATIDAAEIARWLDDAPVIESEGRLHPVAVEHLEERRGHAAPAEAPQEAGAPLDVADDLPRLVSWYSVRPRRSTAAPSRGDETMSTSSLPRIAALVALSGLLGLASAQATRRDAGPAPGAGGLQPVCVSTPPICAAWTATSDQPDSYFALVSTAGDVNGDGFDDVLVGAPRYDNGETNEGRVHLYPGSATGLAASPLWTAESDQADANFGGGDAAGDVNGDGYGDVVVEAYLFDNGQQDEGRAFVYLGSATGLSASPA